MSILYQEKLYHVPDALLRWHSSAGDSLHIWDPSASYLRADDPGITAVGKKFQHVGSDLVTQFQHQFRPFAFSGLDMDSEANATLIRLPLRTQEQAKMSKLAKV